MFTAAKGFHKIATKNGYRCPYPAATIQQELNKIFGQAAVNWQVTIDPDLPVESIRNKKFEDGGTGLLSKYTGHMKEVFRVYENKRAKIDKETMYIFLVGNAENTRKEGFMPPKKNCGFLFVDQLAVSDNFHKVLAHELGHGAFHLKHPWSEKYIPEGSQQYNNLMDYTRNDTRLHKYQWDLLHNPAPMLGLFQDEEEGAYVDENNIRGIARLLRSYHCAKNKGKSYESFYLGKSIYEIKIGDLAKELELDIPTFYREKIEFSFGNNASAGFNYFKDIFDIKNLEFDDKNKQLKIKGQKLTLSIRCLNYYSSEKENVYSFIKKLFTEAISIQNNKDSDELTVKDLEYCSICTFESIGLSRRKELLKELSNYNWIYDPQEKVVINLISSTPSFNKVSIFQYLNKEVSLLYRLYSGVDDYRKEFINSLFLLYASVKDDVQFNHVAYAKLGSTVKGESGLGVYDIYRIKGTTAAVFTNSGIDFTLKKKLLIEFEWSLPALLKNRDGEVLFSALPFDIIETELTSIEIGKFYSNVTQKEVAVSLPAIYLKYLLDEQISQLTKNEFAVLGDAGMNVALLIVGVGELQAGISALKNGINCKKCIEAHIRFCRFTLSCRF